MASVINANIMALQTIDQQLSAQWRELDAAEHELVHAGDSFEIQMVARCTVAALEAVAVAKTVTAVRALCTEGVFVAQCAAVGLTTKEITQYVVKTTAVRSAAIAVTTQSAAIIAKSRIGTSPGWTRPIPIVGSVCDAYNYSNRVFTAPQLIAELGNQKAAIQRLKGQIAALIREQQAKLKAADDERKGKCGGR